MTFRTKRIFEPVDDDDGLRVLVDRLWPRGVSRERAQLDEWAKDVAPSTELRTWFGHDPSRFDEFRVRYEAELATNPAVSTLAERGRGENSVTLLYAAHDETVNHAVVLRDHLQRGEETAAASMRVS